MWQTRPPVVAGVAGGVGTTMVACALRPAVDRQVYRGGPVDVLVCRSTVASVRVAHRAIAAAPGRPVLVVVQDMPQRPPTVVQSLLSMVLPHCAAIVGMPFVADWRRDSNPWCQATEVAMGSVARVPRALRAWFTARQTLAALVRAQLPYQAAPEQPHRSSADLDDLVPHRPIGQSPTRFLTMKEFLR